jgi:dCMP deaminase
MRTGMEWDMWYHELCQTVAKKSQCLSRKIGAILVRDKAVVAQGYNGPPRGVRTCDERWIIDEEMRQEAINKSIKHPGNDGLSPFEDIDKDFYRSHLEGKCPRYVPEMGFKSGEGLEWCVAGHAERNALINAARFGIATEGTIIYMDCGVPCTPCLVEIINAGCKEIVVASDVIYDKSAAYVLKESGIPWRVYSHLQ